MGQLQVNHRIILLTFGLVAAASIGLPSYAGDVKVAAKFDANRLRTGTFVYQNLMGEKDIGKSEISIRKTPGASIFDFSNVVTGEFSQRWTAITKENLQPTSAKLSSGQGRGTPVYRVLVTIQKPRMLVREEFPDGTTTDLVSGPINSVAFVRQLPMRVNLRGSPTSFSVAATVP